MSRIEPRPLVLAVDGSPSSDRALVWACDEARRDARPLHVVHARPDLSAAARGGLFSALTPEQVDQLEAASQELLDSAVARARELAPGVLVTGRLTKGSPARAVIEASPGAFAVVMGARGRGAVTSMLLGSVSAQVARHARCPVVVVKDVEDPQRPREGVVVGIDGSPQSDAALAFAFEEADSRRSALDVVHAWSFEHLAPAGVLAEAMTKQYQSEPEHRQLVEDTLAPWRDKYPGVEIRPKAVHALAVPALLEASDGAHLLVVGSRGHGGFADLLLGSVSRNLLQRAGCPVAVVR